MAFMPHAIEPNYPITCYNAGISPDACRSRSIRIFQILPVSQVSKALICIWLFLILRIQCYLQKLCYWYSSFVHILRFIPKTLHKASHIGWCAFSPCPYQYSLSDYNNSHRNGLIYRIYFHMEEKCYYISKEKGNISGIPDNCFGDHHFCRTIESAAGYWLCCTVDNKL